LFPDSSIKTFSPPTFDYQTSNKYVTPEPTFQPIQSNSGEISDGYGAPQGISGIFTFTCYHSKYIILNS
jgi:hypothetical protein